MSNLYELYQNYQGTNKVLASGKRLELSMSFCSFLKQKAPDVFKVMLSQANEDETCFFRDFLALQTPEITHEYFTCCETLGYFSNHLLLLCIQDLVHTKSMEERKEKMKRWSCLSPIQSGEISLDGSGLLWDQKKQSYVFQRAEELFGEAYDLILTYCFEYGLISDLKDTKDIQYLCHLTSLLFVQLYPECYAVTAECPRIFKDTTWLHSYVLTPDKKTVIDVANCFVMPKSQYEMLVNPQVLHEVQGIDLQTTFMEYQKKANGQLLGDESALISMAICEKFGKHLNLNRHLEQKEQN